MKRLIQTTAFEQIASNDLTAIPIRVVCDNFIEDVVRLSETEKDPRTLFRTLCYTRFRLQTIYEKYGLAMDMGKKCIRVALCH